MSKNIFRKIYAVPQDHGAWVFIFTPLLIGLLAGSSYRWEQALFFVAALLAFLIRQPFSILVKGLSGRRPKDDIAPALAWIAAYGLLLAGSFTFLLLRGYTFLLGLALPAVPIFAWHLWLVSRREERKQPIIEIVATGVLALAAPGMYWIGQGQTDLNGWWLWLLVWAQSAGSIVFAFLRLDQREWLQAPPLRSGIQSAGNVLIFTTLNLLVTLGLGLSGHVPAWVWLAFIPQLFETVFTVLQPPIRVKAVIIGMRQLVVSIVFAVIFIAAWRLV